jgi:hypothetical protein
MWQFRGAPRHEVTDRPVGDISVLISRLQQGLRSEPSRVEGAPNVSKSGKKWRFFGEIPAFVH